MWLSTAMEPPGHIRQVMNHLVNGRRAAPQPVRKCFDARWQQDFFIARKGGPAGMPRSRTCLPPTTEHASHPCAFRPDERVFVRTKEIQREQSNAG